MRPPLRPVTFRLPPDVTDRLREHSARTGIPQARIVADALREHLADGDDPQELIARVHALLARLAAIVRRA